MYLCLSGPEARCSSDYTLSDTTDFAHTPVSAGRHGDVSSSVGLTMERKKKKGIFSLFSRKKEGKFKPVSLWNVTHSTSLPPLAFLINLLVIKNVNSLMLCHLYDYCHGDLWF